MDERQRGRMHQLLREAISQTKQWENARTKAVLQLQSLHNLAMQLETVERSDSSRCLLQLTETYVWNRYFHAGVNEGAK